MFYSQLRYFRNKTERKRAAKNLLKLRQQLVRDIPLKDSEEHLLLATWNIRDLTKTKNRRLQESLVYIAEIISRFDFVAVQEVNDMEEWNKIMRILGPDWDFIATDVADSKSGGNGERLTYVFDTRKVKFQNIAGEVVLPNDLLISQTRTKVKGTGKKKTVVAGKQFSRTPYIGLFQSGWFKFAICTVHIYYGSTSGAKLQRRIEEIETISKYFKKKADKEYKNDKRCLILLGDFNIVSPKHKTMQALESGGFVVPETLKTKPSNQLKTKYYDQIAFQAKRSLIDFVEYCEIDPDSDIEPGGHQCNAGVLDFYESVFNEADEDTYNSYREKKSPTPKYRSFVEWRSHQMSDHLPMWVRLEINATDDYLKTYLK